MTARRCPLLLVLALALPLVAARPAGASDESRRPFAEFLPPRTLAFVEVPDAPALGAVLARSPFAEVWNEPSVAELFAPLRERLEATEADLAARGLTLRTWAEGLTGRVGLALVDVDLTREVPYPDLILIVDGGAALAGPLEAAMTRRGGREVAAGEREHRGTPVRTLRRGALRLEIATAGDTLVAGTVDATLDGVLDALAGRSERSLASVAGHRLTVPKLPAGGARAFLSPPAVHRSLGEFLFPYEAWLKETGLTEVDGVGLAFTGAEGGFEEVIRIAAPRAADRGLFRLAGRAPWPEGFWHGVPRESFWVAATRVDPEGVWDELFRVSAAVYPGAAEALEAGRQRAEEVFGVRLREDLVKSLEGTAVAYAAAGRGGRPIPDVVLRVDLADPERLAAAVTTAVERAAESDAGKAFEHESRTYRGRTTHWLRAPDQPVMPSWCVDGRHLWIALHPTTLRAALRRAEAAAKETEETDEADETGSAPASVLDHPGFARSLERVRAGGGTFVWFDLPAALRYGLAAARPWLTQKLSGDRRWVDVALLPDGDVVADRFGSFALSIRGDDGGVTIRSHSPVGFATPVMGVLGSLVLAGTARLTLADPTHGATLRERETAGEIHTIDADRRNLDEIGAGLLVYAIDHEGRYPATLADLVAAGALPDDAVLLSPHDDAPEQVGAVRCSYRYAGPAVGALSTKQGRTVVAWSKQPPRTVLFLDGSVRRVKDEAEFRRLLAGTRARLEEDE